ncbi:MAG: crossover junction endodeoxyribonuclease RuvC [Spirochaetales bacterium]|nr:crossover junction endodeoxyribonuclease RuvC [Spirochaetales bacterium]
MGVILGIDPGLANTGYGIIRAARGKVSYLSHGVIETASGLSLGIRLNLIYDAVSQLIDEYKPEIAGMEDLYFAKNRSSAIPVAQAKGIMLLALYRKGVATFEYSPPAIKLAMTGSGRATKDQVQEMVRIMLGLKEVPGPDHASDALSAAICCYHNYSASVRGVKI